MKSSNKLGQRHAVQIMLFPSAAAGDTTHMRAIGSLPGPFGTVTAEYTVFGDANPDGKVDGSDYLPACEASHLKRNFTPEVLSFSSSRS